MKIRISLPALVCAAMLPLATDCAALTPFEENFNGSALDPSVWETAAFKNASLVQNKQRLNFLVGPVSDPDEDYAYIELLGNQPSINESWQAIVDVTNTTGQRDNVGVGFWIYNTSRTGDVVFFEFYGNPTKKSRTSVRASFVVNSQDAVKQLDLKPKLTSGKLMVSFSAKTKLFTFSFGKRVPKQSGKGTTLVWQKMGTFSPAADKNPSGETWLFDRDTRFGIRLEGYGENRLVTGGQASMDNFVLRAPK